jgi:cell division protein FtsW
MSESRYLFFIVTALTLFGLLMIGTSSMVDAARNFGDKWYYLKLQSMWTIIAFLAMIFFSRFDHRKLQKYAFGLLAVSLVLLVAVLIPGIGVKLLGARRWINIGISIQPSEITKLFSAVYFSSLLTKPGKHFQFIGVLGLICGLIMLEPDLGTTLVIIGMSMLLYFGSGGSLLHLGTFSAVGLILILLMIVVSPYRLNRLKSYMDVSHDPLGSSYQIRQALIALGSGGVFGQGLGQSKQKYTFLPETTTDSIFAVIGEELGLFGTAAILLVYLILINKGLKVAKSAKSKFSSNLAISLTAMIGFQALINISAITALVPLTGIPLTFISYGGSSLLIMLSAAGILINIARNYE